MRRNCATTRPLPRDARAFTLIEVLVVVLIIGILAAVVVPRFAGATEDARASSLDSVLSGVRGSIAAYRTHAIIAGEPPFPTVSDLETPGEVMPGTLPANPYTGSAGVAAVTREQALRRTVLPNAPVGWLYFADSSSAPPIAIFYANSNASTGLVDDAGASVGANER